MPAWIVMRMVIIGPSPAAIPASPASIPATVPTAIPAAPAPVPSIIGPTPAPSVGIIAPVPPQTVGERRESIGIQSVSINVPIPRIQSIDYIPIQRTTDADGIARIAETNDAHSVFIIVFRTIEAVYPFTVGIGHCLFFDIKSILILRKVIFFRVITTVIFIHIAHIPLLVLYHNGGSTRICTDNRFLRFYNYYVLRSFSYRLFLCFLGLLFSLLLRGYIIEVVIYTLCRECPREAQG